MKRQQDSLIRRRWLLVAIFSAASVTGLTESGVVHAEDASFIFRDVGEECGLFPSLTGIRGHGAGWGDVDGNGFIDLYVATFDNHGSKANQLFRNDGGRFHLDEQAGVGISARATGVVFADLNNNGLLDLYVGSMPAAAESHLGERAGHALAGCSLFRNDGEGQYTNISDGNGACPTAFGGRSVAVLDYDGDRLLDLLVGEDPNQGYNGSPTTSSRLFRNLGGLQFADVSREAGLPEGVAGLGVAAADVNADGRPDLFLASSTGNHLYLNNGKSEFSEAPGSQEVFAWPTAGGDNMVCGVSFGDVNHDGLPDVVIGQHYDHPWRDPVANRLYLHRGMTNGVPRFEDVTEAVGLVPLPMKAPHVEIQDFDNDGRPDISTSLVKFDADNGAHPVIFRNLGVRDGLPRFRESALGVNDFPTDVDRTTRGSSKLFERLLQEKKVIYTAPGPSGDFDNDGRLDLFLASWWVEAPSLLLHNETPGGNWLQVQVEATENANRMGIGSRVNVYRSGRLCDSSERLGFREISTGYGYASGQPAIAHFGLGDVGEVDIEVQLPHGAGMLSRHKVKANQRITITSQNLQ